MRVTGNILSLDIGNLMGFAKGAPLSDPVSGTVRLRKNHEPRETTLGNLIAWLDQEFTAAAPELLVKETMLSLQAFANMDSGESSYKLQSQMHGIIEGMCQRYGIPFDDVADSTARKHLLGIGRLGDRDATKAAVVQRCKLLKYVPADSTDHNRADALATWDYACFTYGRGSKSTTELHLFEQKSKGASSHARRR